jgi:hypothetical protein
MDNWRRELVKIVGRMPNVIRKEQWLEACEDAWNRWEPHGPYVGAKRCSNCSCLIYLDTIDQKGECINCGATENGNQSDKKEESRDQEGVGSY